MNQPAVSNQIKANKNLSFAEITQSSLQLFTAQSWQWNDFPAFGSLVTVQAKNRTLFGIVYEIQTGSSDPHRFPFTYKKTEEELRAEQPQIFEFMQTSFSCLAVGFLENNQLFYQIPPEPPQMHAFISHATDKEIAYFFSSCAYLHLIFCANLPVSIDELLLSFLRTQAELKLLTNRSCIEFIETIQLISGDDYRRLKILIHRSESILSKI